jgi:integrase
MRASFRLSATKIARITKPGRYSDGQGLWLQVAPGGSKSWLFRYMRSGVARQMGLGPLHTVGLAQARELARQARQTLLEGRDPIEARRAGREASQLEAARSVTFKECAERYISAHESSWRNPKHRAQWRATLTTYAFPIIGDLPVSSVDVALVLRILEPLWSEKRETAGRLRGRIECVLDWASARKYRAGDNPARWRGHLDKLLAAKAKHSVRHHPALAYKDLPAFMTELRWREGLSARALEFVVLTAARTGEAIGATWDEIDLGERVWRVPGSRMKGGRPHTVPLSGRALAILEGLPRIQGCPFLFPGLKPGSSLSNMAMLELMRDMRPGFVPHGFRSTFRDWAAECTAHPAWVAEAALAHVVADRVEAAYRRGELLEKRRGLMADWAIFCGAPSSRALASSQDVLQRPGHGGQQRERSHSQ